MIVPKYYQSKVMPSDSNSSPLLIKLSAQSPFTRRVKKVIHDSNLNIEGHLCGYLWPFRVILRFKMNDIKIFMDHFSVKRFGGQRWLLDPSHFSSLHWLRESVLKKIMRKHSTQIGDFLKSHQSMWKNIEIIFGHSKSHQFEWNACSKSLNLKSHQST